jgi:DNA-binding transcriptional ArsR family regulator
VEAHVAKSTLSHHFKVLREAGITHTRANGTHRLMSLRKDDLEGRFPGLLSSVLNATKVA